MNASNSTLGKREAHSNVEEGHQSKEDGGEEEHLLHVLHVLHHVVHHRSLHVVHLGTHVLREGFNAS